MEGKGNKKAYAGKANRAHDSFKGLLCVRVVVAIELVWPPASE